MQTFEGTGYSSLDGITTTFTEILAENGTLNELQDAG